MPDPPADRERSRIRARHLDALEERLHVLVNAGHHAQTVADASAPAEQYPLREGPHRQPVQALCRAGRQADAPAAYRKARRMLNEEPDIAPGPDQEALHAPIPRGDRSASAPSDAVRRRAPVPRQLPHAAADFTGRVEQTKRIHDTLVRHPARTMPVVLVTGMGGVGKTALVMHGLQAVLASYPDGQLHADLRGAGGAPADPGAVLSAFLRALGRTDSVIPDDLDERAALYRTLLAQRRVLVVLDDAAGMEQVLPLLPASPSCAVVITSRNGLAPLPVSLRLSLGALPDDEALALFTRLVGDARVRAEPQAVRQVLASCAGLPLAVRVIGARLAARPEWNMAELAERLADEQHRLSELSVESVAVEASFAVGYTQLDDCARRTFRLLSLPAHSGFDVLAAAQVTAAPREAVAQALERLVSAGLLESPAVDRYRYHDLVLLFAQRLAARTDSAAERYAALGRLLDHHLVVAAGAHHFLMPGHTVSRTALPVLRDMPLFMDDHAVLAWTSSQLGDILRLITQTAASHMDRAATVLLMLNAAVMNAHRWRELVPVAARVCAAATAAGDLRSEGRARYMLAGAFTQAGRSEDARGHVLRALDLTRRAGDVDVHAMALTLHGTLVGRHDPNAGLGHHLRAAELAHQRGNSSLEAVALGNMVQTRLLMAGIDEDTVAASRRQLELYRRNADRCGEAAGHYRHGQVLLRQGLAQEAIASHHRTLSLLREGERDFLRGGTHMRLSEAYLHAGQAEAALEHAERALALSREVHHEHLAALALSALGDALAALNRHEEARLYWQRAVEALRRLGCTNDAQRVARRLSRPPAQEAAEVPSPEAQ